MNVDALPGSAIGLVSELIVLPAALATWSCTCSIARTHSMVRLAVARIRREHLLLHVQQFVDEVVPNDGDGSSRSSPGSSTGSSPAAPRG